MTTDARIKLTTDLAFQRLAGELTSLAPEADYIDGASYLLMFAELVTTDVTAGMEYVRLHLNAGLPGEPFREIATSLTPPAIEHLRMLIEEPRRAADAEVNHFFALAGQVDPFRTTIYDLLLDDSLQPLRNRRDGAAGDSARVITKRMDAFLAVKAREWGEIGTAVLSARGAGALSDRERNKLDKFIFLRPDVLALSLPILGSPVVHLYLGVNDRAYNYDLRQLVARLYNNTFRRLREAVLPFFLARLAAVASKYLAVELLASPVSHTARFLREAGGLLLAKSLTMPSSIEGEDSNGYTCPVDLRDFEDGATLEIDLPAEGWLRKGKVAQAVFQLPKFNVLLEHGEGVLMRSSVELDGLVVQLATVRTLVEQLTESVYSLAIARKTVGDRQAALVKSTQAIAEREARINTALKWVYQLRRTVGPELNRLTWQLVEARAKTRSFLERLPEVMHIEPGSAKLRKAGLEAAAVQLIEATMTGLITAWKVKLGTDYPGSGDLAHFLRELDQLQRSVETDTLRSDFADAVVTCGRAVTGVALNEQPEAFENLTSVVRLLSQTRFWSAGKRYQSILGWALDHNLLSDETRRPDFTRLLAGKSLGNAGEIGIESVKIEGVAPLAVTIFLAVVASWYRSAKQTVSIIGEARDGFHFLVRVHDPRAQETSERRKDYKSLVNLIQEARTDLPGMERFRVCLSLLDTIYEVQERSPMPSPSGEAFEVYLDIAE